MPTPDELDEGLHFSKIQSDLTLAYKTQDDAPTRRHF